MLDLHRLRIFRSVVASGSINAAATHLGYTPSTVSQHVATLQRETGLKLLTHVGRGVEPTEAGRELANLSGRVLTHLAEVESRVKDLRDGRSGALSIQSFDSATTAWLPAVARRILTEFPGLHLRIALAEGLSTPADAGDASDIQAQAASDAPDLRLISAGPGYQPPAGYQAHCLLEEDYQAIVPAGHRLATSGPVDLAELRAETWIASDSPDSPCAVNVQRSCAAAGFAPAFAVETTNHVAGIAFVAAGVGLTVVPRLCTLGLPPGVAAVDLTNPTPTRTVYALVNANVLDRPAMQLALRALHECAAAATGLGDLRR